MIRILTPEDEAAAARLLDATIAGRVQVRMGEVHDVLALPGFVAEVDGAIAGLVTYEVEGPTAELAALAVEPRCRLGGIGSALIEAVVSAATGEGARELWLVTTNDNLDALRLYQRRGFRLREVRPGAVDESRALKPAIPEIGQYGIPLRDELILVRPLPRPNP